MSDICRLSETIVVTVTYGQREHLLRQVLDALLKQSVARVVVVDNGAHWPVAQKLAVEYGEFVDVVTLGRNAGSAGGFRAGIKRAIELQAEFIWLLDDDNRPESSALANLLHEYGRQLSSAETALLAMSAQRKRDIDNVFVPPAFPRCSSYNNFHFIDIPKKIIKRLPLGKFMLDKLDTSRIRKVPVVPYGGLFFHASLLSIIGYPNEDFTLYYDDYEWTSRITNSGGAILFFPSAVVIDLQNTWGSSHGNYFLTLLHGDEDTTAYYAMRNGAYFSEYVWCRNRFVFYLNRLLFFGLLWSTAKMTRSMRRYNLLCRAARDGHRRRIGSNPEFPL
jgi:GT2 family glycosyltransferase